MTPSDPDHELSHLETLAFAPTAAELEGYDVGERKETNGEQQ